MGTAESKSRIRELEQEKAALVRKNEQMNKILADERAEAQRQNQAAFEQVAKMMLLLALAGAEETKGKTENKEIEIEGTTYQLVEFIDRGGFGEVHKAKVKGKEKLVALKIMKNTKAIAEEVKNEINFLLLTKQIKIENHPVILCYGCKTTSDNIYIAMELAAVDLLNFWLQQINKGDNENIVAMGMIIIVYTLRALTFLEQLSIIHGDIKPQNMVIVPNGDAFCVKLIDFGTVEKMYTKREVLTVDASKAYTLFFASPEFLRRDSKNLVSRRLHKKSDAWAAGVMFHLLFCGSLPWKDGADYENFCNDPSAQDIVVPEIGGFKVIIELLLKKNPEHRASAKSTLLQMKAHPTFGQVIQALHSNFCPVDDVCHMKIPANVHDGLMKMGRVTVPIPEKSSGSDEGHRVSCRYGRNCYRKDEAHRQEYAHPGDSDYSEAAATTSARKRACRYGASCYQRDPEHRQKFTHPEAHTKAACKFGADCLSKDPDHLKKFSHKSSSGGRPSGKQRCHFGPACNKRDDREHMKTYLHDD